MSLAIWRTPWICASRYILVVVKRLDHSLRWAAGGVRLSPGLPHVAILALLYCRLQSSCFCDLYPAKSYPATTCVTQYFGLS
jgi:hypothetical protein